MNLGSLVCWPRGDSGAGLQLLSSLGLAQCGACSHGMTMLSTSPPSGWAELRRLRLSPSPVFSPLAALCFLSS